MGLADILALLVAVADVAALPGWPNSSYQPPPHHTQDLCDCTAACSTEFDSISSYRSSFISKRGMTVIFPTEPGVLLRKWVQDHQPTVVTSRYGSLVEGRESRYGAYITERHSAILSFDNHPFLSGKAHIVIIPSAIPHDHHGRPSR